MSDRAAVGPDRTSRSLRPRPITFGIVAVGALAGAVGLAMWSGPPAILALALLGAVALDAGVARSALTRLDLAIANPMDAIAGQRVNYVVRAPGLTRPVQLVRPADWDRWLDPELADPGPDLLVPGTAGVLDAWPVGAAVGNVRNDGPELSRPVQPGG